MLVMATKKVEEQARIEIHKKLKSTDCLVHEKKQLSLMGAGYKIYRVSVHESDSDTISANFLLLIADKMKVAK